MPLVSNKKIGPSAVLLLWLIEEDEERLRTLVNEDDREAADRFSAPRRRKEHLAWRAALRTVLPDVKIEYSDAGAPMVPEAETPLYIGVAHTSGLAAVVVSGAPCAVDAEREGRDFSRTAPRFISPEEQSLDDAGRADFPAAVWCAKEAMYKYSGRRELDFLRDLTISGSDVADGKMEGRILGEPVRLDVERSGEYLIIYII